MPPLPIVAALLPALPDELVELDELVVAVLLPVVLAPLVVLTGVEVLAAVALVPSPGVSEQANTNATASAVALLTVKGFKGIVNCKTGSLVPNGIAPALQRRARIQIRGDLVLATLEPLENYRHRRSHGLDYTLLFQVKRWARHKVALNVDMKLTQ